MQKSPYFGLIYVIKAMLRTVLSQKVQLDYVKSVHLQFRVSGTLSLEKKSKERYEVQGNDFVKT